MLFYCIYTVSWAPERASSIWKSPLRQSHIVDLWGAALISGNSGIMVWVNKGWQRFAPVKWIPVRSHHLFLTIPWRQNECCDHGRICSVEMSISRAWYNSAIDAYTLWCAKKFNICFVRIMYKMLVCDLLRRELRHVDNVSIACCAVDSARHPEHRPGRA